MSKHFRQEPIWPFTEKVAELKALPAKMQRKARRGLSPQAYARISLMTSPVNIGEAHITAAVTEGELRVVDAQQVQHGGVQIVDGHFVLHDFVAVIVGRPEGRAAFDAAAGHPHREGEGIVISPILALSEGRAAKLAGPDDQRAIEQAART